MTEEEWLRGHDYPRMYRFVHLATARQARLCMVACCRIRAAEVADTRVARILDAAERCADDPEAERAANAIGFEWVTTRHPLQRPQSERWKWLHQAVADAHALFEACYTEEMWDHGRSRARDPRAAIANALSLSLRESPLDAFIGGEGDAVYCCLSAIDRAGVLRLREARGLSLQQIDAAKEQIQRSLADLLRDIVGNPFRPVAFSPAWRTSTAVSLARAVYESRDFGAMPILADALQDAGCDSDDILAHCRDTSLTHVRGCWVTDFVLGKS